MLPTDMSDALDFFSTAILSPVSESIISIISEVPTATDSATLSGPSSKDAATTKASPEKPSTSIDNDTQPTASTTESITVNPKVTNTVSKSSLQTPTPSSNDGALTGLPTLTGGYTIVAPSVPPTQNAPFMRQSNLPEGTVFIVVGAILGFCAVSVLAWRMGVAWCLHRSVKKAAFSQGMSDTKALYRTPAITAAPFYKYTDRSSVISLSGMGAKGVRKGSKTAGAAQSSSNTANLFFSPTAGAHSQNGTNRASTYFPAGYYSAGGSTPGIGLGQTPLAGPGISLTNLSAHSQGNSRSRSVEPSPPDSPVIRTDANRSFLPGTSILNLNQMNSSFERAPSAYLEDLFDGENIGSRTSDKNDRQNSKLSNSSK